MECNICNKEIKDLVDEGCELVSVYCGACHDNMMKWTSPLKWISVKDRLPNKYERVLVTDGKQVCLHYKQSWCNFEGCEGEDLYPIDQIKGPQGNWVNCCHIEEGKITHWAYIDDMPRPDKED